MTLSDNPIGGAAARRDERWAAAAEALAQAERQVREQAAGDQLGASDQLGAGPVRRPVVPPDPAVVPPDPADGPPDSAVVPPDPADEDPEPDPESVARAIVLRQLAMAPKSRQQLADKLRQKGCADEVANRVLDRMSDVGLVDDEAYADMLVRSRQATRGLAKRALAYELRGKGVADETIADALGAVDPASERALAEDVARRTMRRLGGLEAQVQARRLAGVLSRKGYPPSVVYAVVRQAIDEAPEHQRD